MVDFATVMTLGTNAVKIAKDLWDADKQYDAATIKLKVAELTGNITDLKTGLAEARDALVEKDAEIGRLKSFLKKREAMVEIQGYPYSADEAGNPQGAPFCPVCQEKDQLHFRLVFPDGGGGGRRRPMSKL
jgi:hypothetical protein